MFGDKNMQSTIEGQTVQPPNMEFLQKKIKLNGPFDFSFIKKKGKKYLNTANNSKIKDKKIKKRAAPKIRSPPKGCRDGVHTVPTSQNHLTTVTRWALTPSVVVTRTMYMPALNWAMFRTYSSVVTSVSYTT